MSHENLMILQDFFIKTFGVIIEFVSEKISKKFHNNVKSNQKKKKVVLNKEPCPLDKGITLVDLINLFACSLHNG